MSLYRRDEEKPTSPVPGRRARTVPGNRLALRELGFLQRLGKLIASTVEPDDLVQLVILETTQAMEVDVCSLYMVQADGNTLSLSATNGLNQDMVGRVTIPIGEGITGWVAHSREPMLVSDVAADPHWKWIPGLDEDRLHSFLSVPIEAGPRLVGVINVQTAEYRDFSPDDVEFLRAIAGQVAGILERSELNRRLQEQLREVQLSHDIHERFTELALSGAGIRVILEAVGQTAGGPAMLYSPHGVRVRGTEGALPDGFPARLPLPPEMRANPRGELMVKVGKSERRLTITPVRAGADLLGIMAVGWNQDAAVEADSWGRHQALQHGATVLALELAKERAAAAVERRYRGDLVEHLLNGGLEPLEMERLARQAERLGYALPQQSWVVVIEPHDDRTEALMAEEARRDRLDVLISDLGRRRLPGALIHVRANSIVVLLPSELAAELVNAERLTREVMREAGRVLRPGQVSAGIGNLASTISELPRAFQEARQALRLVRRTGESDQVATYRSLGAFRLLLEVQSPEALRRFVDEVLGELVRYQESRDTPLLATLEALVAARWVRRAAARQLGIHINSMNYRIERVEELTGINLDDPEARVAVAIALKARSMIRPG